MPLHSFTRSQHKEMQKFFKRYNLNEHNIIWAHGDKSIVYVVFDSKLEKIVALKAYLKKELSSLVLKGAKMEGEIMSKLRHPNILRLNDSLETKHCYYLVMDMMTNDLRNLFNSQKMIMNERQKRQIFQQILLAVNHCHENKIIHRDLKMENVLIDQSQSSYAYQIKLCDFGSALEMSNIREKVSPGATNKTTLIAMSPEQVLQKPYNYKIDSWALGVILFELLTQKLPFDDIFEPELRK